MIEFVFMLTHDDETVPHSAPSTKRFETPAFTTSASKTSARRPRSCERSLRRRTPMISR